VSIDKAKKSVENVQSWGEARDYAVRRMKDLKFSLRVFEKMIKDGVPWPSDGNSTPVATVTTSCREYSPG